MNETTPSLWRRLLDWPIKRNRFRDWFFGKPVPAFVALSLIYDVVGFGLVLVLFYGSPYDAGVVLPFVAASILLTLQGIGLRRRYRRQHGMDAA